YVLDNISCVKIYWKQCIFVFGTTACRAQIMSTGARRVWTDEEVGISGHERFALELEFVQCLANPLYINWLATKQYFDNPSFINYLKYLQYWKQPAYASHITYPHCLFFLDRLQDPEFRVAIKDFSYAEHIRQAQETFFRNFHSNRVADAVGAVQGTAGDTGSPKP
ncbi:hypothetical protein Vretifemale_949, partial [Volvox reticuliferus]